MLSYRRHLCARHLEICVSGISYHTEPHNLLTYFEQFGTIDHYNFTSPDGGGIVFITYTDRKNVDQCMASRPHRLDGQHLYVKRALPFNSECPREHIDSSRDIMILADSMNVNEQFLKDLREYFSTYGTLYACKYCHQADLDYILVEFADYDQVDRVILDKPHYFNKIQLNVMKYMSTNKTLLNMKHSPKHNEKDNKILASELSLKDNSFRKFDDLISEISLENEIRRLQNVLKQINEDFNIQRQKLEDDCCEQLRKLNEDAGKAHQLQQNLEQEYAKLLVEYESLQQENETLNEQYLMAELENFEITSYYEQILVEEKAKTAQCEAEYTQKLELLYADDPMPPAIPDDIDD